MIGRLMRRRTGLPLDRDAGARYVPWLIGVMVLLATLALATALVLGAAADAWRGGLVGSATIQVPPSADHAASLPRILDLARRHPGVVSADPVPADRAAALLAPWLGDAAALLALPSLVDLKISPGRFDAASLQAAIRPIAAGAVVDDHRQWIEGVAGTARLLEAVAIGVLALITAVAALSVGFAVRTGLAAHRDAVEVLHLIGARDQTIADAFALQALRAALLGGAIGWSVAALLLWLIAGDAADAPAGLGASLTLGMADWIALAAVPIVTALVAAATARTAALLHLSRLP